MQNKNNILNKNKLLIVFMKVDHVILESVKLKIVTNLCNVCTYWIKFAEYPLGISNTVTQGTFHGSFQIVDN